MTDEMQTMNDVISNRLRQVNVSLPGRIESYDADTRKADVLPLINEKYADGTVLRLPIITNVPVVMPATNAARITLPIAAGDGVLIVFSQRSLDLWLSEGGITDAGDIRMHSMSDAVAIPGLFSFKDAPSSGTEIELTQTDAVVRANKVALGTPAVELLDEITKALDATASSNCVDGAPLTLAAQIQAASTAIKTIKGSI